MEPDPVRRARLQRMRMHGFSFRHIRHELVDAVDAATQRVLDVDHIHAAASDEQFGHAALAAFAALVAGEADLGRKVGHVLAEHRPGIVSAWLTARFYAWTGEPIGIETLRSTLETIQLAEEGDDSPVAPRGVAAALLRPLVARDLIAPAEATGEAELVTLARRLAAGGDPTIPVDAMLCHLGGSSTTRRSPHPASILESLLGGAADEPVRAWETLVSSNEPGDRDWILPILVAGILGIEPDAERGRLRARLHLPGAWTDWGARNIRMGDASAEVNVRRNGADISVAWDQGTGALPLTVVLEATVHAPVEDCFVDGRPADLALRPFADRVVVPVQLVLDAPRELRIRLGDGNA